MKKILFTILLIIPFQLFSQELMCRVSVNYSSVTTTNTQVFQDMQRDISEFMNTTKWTDYIFSNEERIECSILINITQFDGVDNFKATLQVSSTRPVYDASLTTPVLNFKEKQSFNFNYMSNEPLEFNENTYTSELPYAMAFYAYVIIGFDFDTFSELGGSEFFTKAQKLVANAQGSGLDIWKSMGTNNEDNRYYLAKNLNSPVYKQFRQAMYKYHRQGLDMMTNDITQGRSNVLNSLELLKGVFQKQPNSVLISMFISTKKQEVINIFSEAPPQEANRAKQIMKLIDPLNSSEYDNMGKIH